MKIRNGFVSNSSSSSFTCGCCGETQSGWDLCPSDAGMKECQRGHVFCEDHILDFTVSPEEKRKVLIADREHYRNAGWKKPGETDAEIAEVKAYSQEDLDDAFSDFCGDNGCLPAECPLCQLENATPGSIMLYALKKFGYKDSKEFAAAMKREFGTYEKFSEFITPPKKNENS